MPRRNESSERTCVVTRAVLPVDALIRFVVAPDGEVVPDIRRKLPGRGVWVTATRAMVETADRKHLLARAFDGKVSVAAGLADRVEALLAAAAASALSLARKAGTAIAGFTKVEAALGSDPVIALIEADGAGADGIAKLRAAARRRFGPDATPVIHAFSADQLDLAFGRPNVIHAALLAGPASDNVLARVRDLARFRGDSEHPAIAGNRSFDASTGMNNLPAGNF